MLVGGGLLGGGMQVAEPLLGLPNEMTALGAPWLVSAFAVGALIRGRVTAALAGALLLGTATALYYAALVYGYGRGVGEYATVMTATWGTVAAAGGAVMAATGSAWRTASDRRAALLAAFPSAALLGEAVLLSFTWPGDRAALAAELACGVAVLLLLSWRRAPLTGALARAVALAFAFALAEAEIRGFMRAAGWHGA